MNPLDYQFHRQQRRQRASLGQQCSRPLFTPEPLAFAPALTDETPQTNDQRLLAYRLKRLHREPRCYSQAEIQQRARVLANLWMAEDDERVMAAVARAKQRIAERQEQEKAA